MDELCKIDAITFNPKSAELVVSVTLYDGKIFRLLTAPHLRTLKTKTKKLFNLRLTIIGR